MLCVGYHAEHGIFAEKRNRTTDGTYADAYQAGQGKTSGIILILMIYASLCIKND